MLTNRATRCYARHVVDYVQYHILYTCTRKGSPERGDFALKIHSVGKLKLSVGKQ